MALSRNFRTTYYKTLGVPVVQHIVDVEASYHAIFGEAVINVPQLTKLAVEVGISPTYRPMAWKILCGVVPAYKCLWDFAHAERQEMYDDLLAAAEVLGRPLPTPTSSEMRPRYYSQPPEAMSIVELYRLFRRDVQPVARYLREDEDEERRWLQGIVTVLQTVLVESVMEQFWCLVRIVDILADGLDLGVPADVFDDITVIDFEAHFVRALETCKSGLRT